MKWLGVIKCFFTDGCTPFEGDAFTDWMEKQKKEANEETKPIRQERILQTERSFLQDGDFLDDELFSPSTRRRKRP